MRSWSRVSTLLFRSPNRVYQAARFINEKVGGSAKTDEGAPC